MARGTKLSVLYTMLRAKLGENTTQTNTQVRYFQLLSDKQKWLANEYDFPFLNDRFDVAVPSGSRYLSFPTIDNEGISYAMNLERPYTAEVFWTNIWQPLDYGIDSQEFNYINSDQGGNTQDPVQRWRWSEEGQFEIWPINVTPVVIRFTGQRALDNLVLPTDLADLDDEMLVLFVAADLLTRSRQQDAKLCLDQATERLMRQRGAYPNRTRTCSLAGCGDKESKWVRNQRLIPIAVHGN